MIIPTSAAKISDGVTVTFSPATVDEKRTSHPCHQTDATGVRRLADEDVEIAPGRDQLEPVVHFAGKAPSCGRNFSIRFEAGFPASGGVLRLLAAEQAAK
ncbi:MAG: hypothetical protein ACYC9Y_00760 [Candidatus Methylomirabilia bacterium]